MEPNTISLPKVAALALLAGVAIPAFAWGASHFIIWLGTALGGW